MDDDITTRPMTALERRREERQKLDPHHLHPFRRLFIGPSPVSARSAVFVAAAIAQDVQIAHPTTIGVIGGTGTIAAASMTAAGGGGGGGGNNGGGGDAGVRTSIDSSVGPPIRTYSFMAADPSSLQTGGADATRVPPPLHQSHILMPTTSRHSLREQRSFGSSPSPKKRLRDLSPLRIPRTGRHGRVQRSASMASQQPAEEATAAHGILRRASSRQHLQRNASQSMVDPPRTLEHDTVKFDVDRQPRRQYSEGSTYYPGHADPFDTSSNAAGPSSPSRAKDRRTASALPLLDLSVDEEATWHDASPLSSPTKSRMPYEQHRLRNAASFLSVGARSARSEGQTPISPTAGGGGANGALHAKPSATSMKSVIHHPHQGSADVSFASPFAGPGGIQSSTTAHTRVATDEWAGNGLSTTYESSQLSNGGRRRSRMEEMRERARERYRNSRVGQKASLVTSSKSLPHPPPAPGNRRQHIRDASRQSRLSYKSTAGTLTSVGTRFTEGSFGASGGFRAKLVRTFGKKTAADLQAPTTLQSIRAAEARRHGRRSASRGSGIGGGVVPGAVGTSAGGTKWIGQTFEVGKRFWQAIENREDLLLGDTIFEEDEEKVAGAHERAQGKPPRPSRQGSDVPSMKRSPSDVLISYAQKASHATGGGEGDFDKKNDPASNVSNAPALVINESDSGTQDIHDSLATNNVNRSARKALEPPPPPRSEPPLPRNNTDHSLERVQSAASLLTVPQDREVQHNWDIESRSGWNDVVSFITAQSIQRSARSAGDNLNEMGNRARRAFDGQLADFRARQAAGKQSRSGTYDPNGIQSRSNTFDSIGKKPRPDEADNAAQLRTSMSPVDVLKQPEAPLGVEDKFAESTFALTRRPSFPGVLPDGSKSAGSGVLQTDAASDHEVAARPTFDDDHGGETMKLKPPPPNGTAVHAVDDASPMEIPSVPVDDQAVTAAQPSILHSSMQNGTDVAHRKTVQFTGTPEASDRFTAPQRSMTLAALPPFSMLQSTAEDKVSTILGGRLRPTVRSGDAAPAPPEEVLSRDVTPDERPASTSVATKTNVDDLITHRSTLKRDRMLVKVAWTPSEDLPKEFTERESRKYALHADPFREYMVVYRSGRLELWDDPSWTSRLAGHSNELKLRLVAPLRRGRAFVSLYSAIDTIFCVSFTTGEHNHRSLFNLRRHGTHVWLFDARTCSGAADWMWELWRELGGEMPEWVDVHIPVLGLRVRIPIPEEMPVVLKTRSGVRKGEHSGVGGGISDNDSDNAGEGYKLINRENVVNVVMQMAHALPQWSELCASLERRGVQFGLTWRVNSTLSWVQHSTTSDGHRRDWAVLVGTILCDTKAPSVLEFRTATHYPQSVQTANGSQTIDEPPAVEGFLWRVKAVSGALTRLYVTTQDGLLFINRPSRAFPPERYIAVADAAGTINMRRSSGSAADVSLEPRSTKRHRRSGRGSASRSAAGGSAKRGPGGVDDTLAEMGRLALELITTMPSSVDELDAQIDAYRTFEKRRLFEQIIHSDGYVDVRDIVLIRSLDERGPMRKPMSEYEAEGKGKERHDDELEDDDPHHDDIGGEEGYELSTDRAALKRARQFEVTMSNGRSIRFEVYSRSVACEWIERLADLSCYWKRREKIDALELMHASGQDLRMTRRSLNPRHAHANSSTGTASDARPLDKGAGSERLAPLLGNVWNMCVLDACRTVLRAGRLFTKKKPYTAFDNRYCILVAGRVLTYKLMTSNRTARARQNAGIFHKRQDTVIHLRDSYVYSGKLTEHMLVNGRSDGAGAISNFGGGSGGATTSSTRHTLPRIYADGLLSTDEDEECTFVLRYRPQRVNQSAEPQVYVGEEEEEVHDDNETREQRQRRLYKSASVTTLRDSTVNVIAMRARSRLERDLWVWAINAERERLVRADKLRESEIRQHGQTPYRSYHQH